MSALADSLRGVARIISVCGNFAATERLVLHKDAMSVRVVVRPPDAHCFELAATLKWVSENPLISTLIAGLLVSAIGYTFKWAAGQREEMKHLRGALESAIRELGTKDQRVIDRMLGTIDKMAEALIPSAKLAVAPIGQTARTLTVGFPDANGGSRVVLDEADKDAILAGRDIDVGEEQTFTILLTELDMETGSCRIAFIDAPEDRVAGKITDPAFQMPNNTYAVSMAAKVWLEVRAKPTLKDGEIDRLFISNVSRVRTHPFRAP